MIRSLSIPALLSATALLIAPIRATAVTPLTTVRVAQGLSLPLFVTHVPGDFGRVFIVEKTGRIKILNLQTGLVLGTAYLDVSSLISTSGERGLLGLAFHPNYASNGFFYVNYTDTSGDTVIARYTVSGSPATSNVANAGSAFIVLTIDQPFSNHNGGWLGFGPNDGYLYIAMGDGGSSCDPGQRAQDITSMLLGKMLRIDVDSGSPYGIPPDNPFVGVTGDDEIWAYGLRNPFRCAFDSANGDLYIGDVGQGEIEEIDYQPASSAGGENYGWDCMEGSACSLASSGCTPSGCTCNASGLLLPIHEYDHSEGNVVTGGEVYRGCAVADLDGTYFFADEGSDEIWSFRVVSGVKQDFQVRTSELAPGGGLDLQTIASFGTDAFGEVYLCDLVGGEVFKIVPDTAGPALDCNANDSEDACDIRSGASTDANEDGIPDECAQQSIPTASARGLAALTLLLVAAGAFVLARRARASRHA